MATSRMSKESGSAISPIRGGRPGALRHSLRRRRRWRRRRPRIGGRERARPTCSTPSTWSRKPTRSCSPEEARSVSTPATGVSEVPRRTRHRFRHPGGKGNTIIPAKILPDLVVGDAKIRPNAESGHKACEAAQTGKIEEGSIGAGAGATIGKAGGGNAMTKARIGNLASIRLP